MSWLSKFVFDPVKAALARAEASSNPAVVAAASAGQATYSKVAADVASTLSAPLTQNSAQGLGSSIVKDLEDGLIAAVDGALGGLLGSSVIGSALAPEVIPAANVGLVFLEQHAATFLAALFSHHKETLAAAAATPVADQTAT